MALCGELALEECMALLLDRLQMNGWWPLAVVPFRTQYSLYLMTYGLSYRKASLNVQHKHKQVFPSRPPGGSITRHLYTVSRKWINYSQMLHHICYFCPTVAYKLIRGEGLQLYVHKHRTCFIVADLLQGFHNDDRTLIRHSKKPYAVAKVAHTPGALVARTKKCLYGADWYFQHNYFNFSPTKMCISPNASGRKHQITGRFNVGLQVLNYEGRTESHEQQFFVK